MVGFLAIVAGAATLANHFDDRREHPEARRTDHEPDAPGA